MSTPLWDRFWPKVDAAGDCWEWTGSRLKNGYGAVGRGGRGNGNHMAHRAAWELLVGEIPAGLVIDHLCRNRGCVNPDHLEPITTRENLLRGHGFSAKNARKTHCNRGHEYTPDNTYTYRGWRQCRICTLAKNTAARAKRAA